MRSIGWTRLVAAGFGALGAIGAAGSARADDVGGPMLPLAPTADEVRLAAAAAPQAVSVVAPRTTFVAMRPADPPLPPGPGGTPPPVRTEPGVTIYGERSGPPQATLAEQHPYGGGYSPTGLAEDTRPGPAGQPEWTTERRWARVRSYVLAPGQVEFESWYRGRYKKKDQGDDLHIFQEEVSVGLPHRFQLDFYLNFEHEESNHFHFAETQVEARYALADWDCLPWNPTLYFEYKLHDDVGEPDVAEVKLLLSKDIGCRWKAGFNFAWEKEMSHDEEVVLGFSGAVSYTVVDQRFSVGAEFQYERATLEGSRDDPEHTLYIGPSLQFRTSSTTHFDVAPLFGVTEDSQVMQLFLIFGVEIGGAGGEGGWLNPISSRSN